MAGDHVGFRAKAEEARIAATYVNGRSVVEDLLKIAIAYERLADWVLAHPYHEHQTKSD